MERLEEIRKLKRAELVQQSIYYASLEEINPTWADTMNFLESDEVEDLEKN